MKSQIGKKLRVQIAELSSFHNNELVANIITRFFNNIVKNQHIHIELDYLGCVGNCVRLIFATNQTIESKMRYLLNHNHTKRYGGIQIARDTILFRQMLILTGIPISIRVIEKQATTIEKYAKINKCNIVRGASRYMLKVIRDRKALLHEELIAWHYHPAKIAKWLEDGNELEDYLQ